MQLAAQNGFPSICRRLLSHGADADLVNRYGWTLTHYIWSYPDRNTSTEEILQLFDSCSSLTPDDLDTSGWSPLHRAAAFGNANDVRVLIRLGANPRRQVGLLNWSPLHLATLWRNNAVIEELVKPRCGLRINQPDDRGWSPLHIAANIGAKSKKTMRRLLELGADPDQLSKSNTSCVPNALKNMRFTPGMAAKVRGPDA